jgi:hypothetical protein
MLTIMHLCINCWEKSNENCEILSEAYYFNNIHLQNWQQFSILDMEQKSSSQTSKCEMNNDWKCSAYWEQVWWYQCKNRTGTWEEIDWISYIVELY